MGSQRVGHNCATSLSFFKVFPGDTDDEVSACSAGDLGLIPGLGRSPGEGNGYPFQYSCLENPRDRGFWWAIVHRVARVRQADLIFLSLTR